MFNGLRAAVWYTPPLSRCELVYDGYKLDSESLGSCSKPWWFLVVDVTLKIDDAFIGEWHPKYDCIEDDEPEYRRLVDAVARDIGVKGTISRETFLDIWKWKGAMRVIRHVRMDRYEELYAETFRRAASEPPERRLAAILAPGVKLPGVEAPTGSTIIHFIWPQSMPIIDVRTVEVLFRAGLVSTKHRDLRHYEEFRKAIEGIRHRCPSWSLRQIDRALFVYHKEVLDKKGQDECRLQ